MTPPQRPTQPEGLLPLPFPVPLPVPYPYAPMRLLASLPAVPGDGFSISIPNGATEFFVTPMVADQVCLLNSLLCLIKDDDANGRRTMLQRQW
mmetsp:Transcript_37256/g.66691  ORF Transcript_37256/g.66691 Transcript_37256/m.66691 type:complete len:93 (-) Transcript_37256:94-372(-)